MSMREWQAFPVATVLMVLALISGCKRGDDTGGDRLDKLPSDEEKLLLIQRLPLGLTYEEVKKKLPSLSALKPEGGLEQTESGLEEAWGEMTVLGRNASLECNFDSSGLYSYYFTVEKLQEPDARALYRELQRCYTMQFGNYHEEHQQEQGRLVSSSLWSSGSFGVVATLLGSEGEFQVSWGFQPLPPEAEGEEPLAGETHQTPEG